MALRRSSYAPMRMVTRVRNRVPAGMKKTLSNYKLIALILGGLFVWLMVKGKMSVETIKSSFTNEPEKVGP